MVHVTLDTCIWIYIANGSHPDITNFISEKIDSNQISILSNEVILGEWERNKAKAKEVGIGSITSDFSKFMDQKDKLKELLSEEIYIETIEKASEKRDNDIVEIEQRIKRVDDILINKSIKVEVTDEIKIKAGELALQKKAPFHNNKNNFADALIFLSAIKFLKDNVNDPEIPQAIFITNNVSDFCQGEKGEKSHKLHPDILNLTDGLKIGFNRNAGSVLKLAPKMYEEIERFYNVKSLFDVFFKRVAKISKLAKTLVELDYNKKGHFGYEGGFLPKDLDYLDKMDIISKVTVMEVELFYVILKHPDFILIPNPSNLKKIQELIDDADKVIEVLEDKIKVV